MATAEPKGWSYKLKRLEELGGSPGDVNWTWLEDPGGTHSDWVNIPQFAEVVSEAKKMGIPPDVAAGIHHAETQTGNSSNLNPMRLHPDNMQKYALPRVDAFVKQLQTKDAEAENIDKLNSSFASLGGVQPVKSARAVPENWDVLAERRANIQGSLQYLGEQIEEFGNNTKGYQAYSGKGAKPYNGRGKLNTFGKSYENTNYWRDKDQGKRVDRLRNTIMQHPLLNEVIKTGKNPLLEKQHINPFDEFMGY